MPVASSDYCILNGGSGSWAFEPLARELAQVLGVPISAEPRGFNYLLYQETLPDDFSHRTFIPLSAIRLAADKRRMAEAFAREGVPTKNAIAARSVVELVAAYLE